MSEKHAPGDLDALLKEIRPQWLAWLRRRHAGLAARHEDIVQEASEDLARYLLGVATDERTDAEIRRIGFSILRRRVADVFRERVLAWNASLPLDQVPDTAGHADLERVLEYRTLLRVVMGLLASLDRESRDLIIRGHDPSIPDDIPLSDAERQKLARLRAELRRQLMERFDIDVTGLLKE
jgi:DNA-directed RNA polymerase specialized sigma24 family protein